MKGIKKGFTAIMLCFLAFTWLMSAVRAEAASAPALEFIYADTSSEAGIERGKLIIASFQTGGPVSYTHLIYTAVTRARSCVTLVGDEQTFYQMIDNTFAVSYTHLDVYKRQPFRSVQALVSLIHDITL